VRDPRLSNRLLIAAVLVVLGGTAPLHAQEPQAGRHDEHDHAATARHRFDDVERWVKVFDDPSRDTWQKPEEVLRFLNVRHGSVVADLGAGTGYFAVHLARAVGSGGRVYAVDIEPAMVRHLRKRCRKAKLDQVIPVLARPDDPRLPPGELDLVLIADTWHHIDDRIEYLDRLVAALRPGGRVAVLDWRKEPLPLGPPPEHKLPREAVVEEFDEGRWTLEAESGELPYQYLLVFAPPSGS
jgi:ubiquinone/menaquinone biosynthesis C-methylase UbiE